jgi:hypothetical protein
MMMRSYLISRRNGDLHLPVPLGVQPGTSWQPCSAPVSTVQPMPARCKHRLRVDDDPLCP